MDFNGLIHTSVEFIKSHPNLSCAMLFLWAFLETGLLLGLLLPAEKLLIMASFLVSQNIISPISFFVCGVSGTVLGYSLSFLLGYILGEEVLKKHARFFRLNEEEFLKAKRFIETKGEFSLIIGRFIPLLRAALPVVIGAFKPKFGKFTLFNVTGAILWIGSYLLMGNLIGELFSFIISHGKVAIIIISIVSPLLYILWRRYGKNTELL